MIIDNIELKESPFSGYWVSKNGEVYSTHKNQWLAQHTDKYGYKRTTVYENSRPKTIAIHRLVALTYLDNPNNYPDVNHIDENKENNNVDNLEWCSEEYNQNYGTRTERFTETIRQKTGHPCGAFDPKTNELVQAFNSRGAAAEWLFGIRNIGARITGAIKRGTAYNGYIWKDLE